MRAPLIAWLIADVSAKVMIAKLVRWYFKALWWMIITMVPLFTLSIPVMPVYDWLRPWPEAIAALKEEKLTGLRWMVGYAFESEHINGELTQYHRKRDFVVFPEVLHSATVYEFSEGTGIRGGLAPRPYSAVGYLMMYAGLISFSWFVSVRKIKWLFRFPKWPNQTLQHNAMARPLSVFESRSSRD